MMTKHHLNISSTSRLGYPHLRFLSGLGDGFLSQKSLLNATSFKFQIDKPKENDTKLILEHFKSTLRTNLDEITSKKVGATLFFKFYLGASTLIQESSKSRRRATQGEKPKTSNANRRFMPFCDCFVFFFP